MASGDTRLIVLRGPCGAGKSTVASQLLGFDVILEGILSTRGYRDVFTTLFREHPHNNYLFYFDVSFEETVRRHSGRAKAALFGEADMRRWYRPRDILGYDFERLIDENSTLDETVRLIRDAAGR